MEYKSKNVFRAKAECNNPSKRKKTGLLQKAEESLSLKLQDIDALSTTDTQKLIHELQMHQIKLEMQNEELRRAQVELEKSRNKYADLYDFAPVGHFLFDKTGIIQEVNLKGATLLGVERKHLLKQRISQFIAREDQDLFYYYRNRLFRNADQQMCELKMIKGDSTEFYAQLEGKAEFDNEGNCSYFRLAIFDITYRKKIENELRENIAQISKKKCYEEIICTVTRSVHRSINLQEVLENAVDAMSKNIEGVDFIGIYMTEGMDAVLSAYRGYSDLFLERVKRIPYPKDFTWETIIHREPQYCADVDTETTSGRVGKDLGIKSYVSMPIQFENKTVGCINISSLKANAFDKNELNLLEIVAGQIEVAINNAKQAELLRESEERYRTLIENSYDLVVETGIDGTCLYASPKHKEVLGYEPAEFIGTNVFEYIHPEDVPAVMAEYQKAILNLSSGSAVYRHRHKNGRWYWVESTGTAFRTANGEIRGVISSRDITGHKQAEEKIAFQASLLDQVRNAVVATDLENRIIFWNKFAESMYQWKSEEVIGRNIFDLNIPVKNQRVEQEILKGIKEESYWQGEFFVKRKDGSVFPVHVVETVIRSGEDDIIGYVSVSKDITLRKQIEERIKKSEAQLSEAQQIANVGSWEWDIASNKVVWSDELYRIFGMEPQDIGITYDEFLVRVHQDDRDFVNQNIINTLVNHEPFSFDHRIVRPDGSIRILHGQGRVALDELGHPIRMIGTGQDITERKRIEEALRESLAKLAKKNKYESIISTVTRSVHQSISLQDVLENAVDAISKKIDLAEDVCIYLVEGNIAVIKAYRNLPGWYIERAGKISYPSGFTWKTIIEGKPIYCPDVDKDTVIGPAGRELGTRSYLSMPISYEGVTVGALIMHSMQKNAFDEGELNLLENIAQQIGVAITNAKQAEALRKAHDELEIKVKERTQDLQNANDLLHIKVEELKQLEQALRQSEEKYRNLYENAPIGIFRADSYGRIIMANPALLRMIGYNSSEELCRQNLENGGSKPSTLCNYKDPVEENNEVRGIESILRKVDGNVIFIRQNERAIRGEDKNILYYEGTVEDITEYKQTEEELRCSHEQLRALTARLHSVREEERTKIARKVHDELGQALTGLRVDLSWILEQLPELYRSDNPLYKLLKRNQQYALFDKIQSMFKLIDETIEQVRNISAELRPGILDDFGLVAAIEWQVLEFQKRTGILCEFVSNVEYSALNKVRSTALFRILQEILTNIIRHANATRVGLSLNEEHNGVVLTVEDNGRGITEEEISSPQSLGLLGMKERALLFEGEISIVGHQGKGTTLILHMPFEGEEN